MQRMADYISVDDGLVDCEVYSAAVYERELESVFGRSWLFLGHEGQLVRRGDYVTTWMGETPVIVVRSMDDVLRAYLNTCATRQVTLLPYDAGHAEVIVCPAHRLGHDTTGSPVSGQAVEPGHECLVPVARVETYGKLIFGCLSDDSPTLRESLGDATWYLDNYLLRENIGGLQLVPGVQRYTMPGNWKLLAENFAGDDYHVAITHASVLAVRAQGIEPRLNNSPGKGVGANLSVATGFQTGVPHGFLEVRIGEEFFEHDLMRAQSIGPEAAEWVRTRRDAVDRNLPDLAVKPYSFHVANLFPTLSIIGNGTSMEAVGLLVWHPRGPHQTSVTQLCLVDAGAPPALQRQMVWALTHQQSAAGVFAPDDHENFERLAENTRTFEARRVPFNYEMGLSGEGVDVRPPEWQDPRWPGLVLPRFTEMIQRDFYRYWRSLMDR
jgi:phenylpropionate dioxygenase-like ring-hydroxylating dioxygenase large terminal subunit